MSAILGNRIRLTIFGESHGPAIGGVLDGLRAGIAVNTDYIAAQMARRAPGGEMSTPRKEPDSVELLSGVTRGVTNGAPLAFSIVNTNTRSEDYLCFSSTPRPSHSDYPAGVKYNNFNDFSGGGHFSGRLTAVLTAAGSIVRTELESAGVRIGAHIITAGGASGPRYNSLAPELDSTVTQELMAAVEAARNDGDSVGGEIECAAVGIPAGIGEPFFNSAESCLAHMLFSVPGVKGLSFGAADEAPGALGSGFNDFLTVSDDGIRTETNNSGGINGGLTNGMPVIFTVKMRPTPSIFKRQQTVDLSRGCNVPLSIKGRHDPCIALRAVPVVEACAALVIYDLMEDNLK